LDRDHLPVDPEQARHHAVAAARVPRTRHQLELERPTSHHVVNDVLVAFVAHRLEAYAFPELAKRGVRIDRQHDAGLARIATREERRQKRRERSPTGPRPKLARA
jgi:hypothetical protein